MSKRWIDYMRLDALLRAPRNPKDHDAELIQASLARFGYVEAIALDERTGKLVAGHGRLDELERAMAAGDGLPEGLEVDDDEHWLVPVQRGWSSADDAEAEAYVVTSNQSTIAGGWRPQELADVLSDLQAGPGLEGVYHPSEFDELLASLLPQSNPVQGDPDDAPPLPTEPTTRLGDVWQLGPHRVVCGDARRWEPIVVALAGHRADMIWTDPPYGVDYVGKTHEALTIEGDHVGGLHALLVSALKVSGAALRPGSPWYLAGPPGPRGTTFRLALAEAGWQLHQTLVWVKDRFVLGHSDYHFRHEDILYGWVPGPGRSGRGKHEGTRWVGDHAQDSVLEFPRPSSSEEHPTMKPVPLVEACLRNSSSPGDLVLDPFGGSGTTLIAAHMLGRRAAVVEVDPRYVDVICQRWGKLTGEEPQRAS